VNPSAQGVAAFFFNPQAGNEVVAGRLFASRGGIEFRSEGFNVPIAADRLLAEWDKTDERIYFKDIARPDFTLYTLDCSILSYSPLPQLAQLNASIRSAANRKEIIRRLAMVSYFLVGFVVIAWVCSWATGTMVRTLAKKVPGEWERSFSEASLEAFEIDLSAVSYSNQVSQLEQLAAPLLKVVPLSGQQVRFHVVQDEAPNAFALPGGHVVVNTGLLQIADNSEQILGVLAHEFAHVTQKHYAQHILSAAGPLALTTVFLHSDSGLMGLLGAGTGVMVAQGFSQNFETEADEIGWEYLLRANINPRGMIEVFEKFKALDAGELKISHAFDSHPELSKRISRLEKKWNKLPNKSGFMELEPVRWNLGETTKSNHGQSSKP
jgi:beta-barrel assembly-enhancing protease